MFNSYKDRGLLTLELIIVLALLAPCGVAEQQQQGVEERGEASSEQVKPIAKQKANPKPQ